MGIRCTEHGDELGAQSKSLHGSVEIRYKKSGDGWEVYNTSEGKVLFCHKYRDDCEDYVARMFDLFRLVASVPWRVSGGLAKELPNKRK
jgi:hypothetical protein